MRFIDYGRDLRTTRDSEFGENRRDVMLDSLRRKGQAGSDLGSGHAFGEKRQYIALSGSEAEWMGSRCSARTVWNTGESAATHLGPHMCRCGDGAKVIVYSERLS